MNSLFLVVLGLSLLVDLALGAWAGANFPHFAKTWGLDGVVPAGTAHFLGWVLGTCLVGFAAIQGIAFHWARCDKDEGPQLAIVFGCWLVLSSLATFAFASAQGSPGITSLAWKFLVVDGLRGAVLTVLGWLTLHAPSVVRELRLPEGARQPRHRQERAERSHAERPRPERRDDSPRRRDEERESRGRVDRGRPRGGRDSHDREDRQRQGRRREEPSGEARSPVEGGRRPPPTVGTTRRRGTPPAGGTAVAAGLESRAVAEARRISPDPAERPLTVVVKGAPERIRPLANREERAADAYPVVPPAVPPSGAVPPVKVAGANVTGDGSGRRRHRRGRRGGEGSTEGPIEEDAAITRDDEPDEPVVVGREIEERVGEGSGEAQEGVSAVRGRSRRRRRRSGSADSSAAGTKVEGEPEERPGHQHASAVEALDMLRLLEPKEPSSPASPRAVDDRAFGRTYRRAGPRRADAPRQPEDD
jgi:hypothetical protein